ncbi:Spy/CpxP family protein refolding chaperone [Thermodesulfobacteriota bacterium]
MNRLIIVLGSLLLVAALAAPALSWGPRRGGGNSKGNWGGGYSGPEQSSRGYVELTEEQRTKLTELDKKFFDETNKTRNDLFAKSAELNTELNTDNPDLAKAKAIQNEISGLRAALDEKRMDYELEVRKITPDNQYSRGYGSGYGRGGGSNMRGYGRNMGRGFGPGSCRN